MILEQLFDTETSTFTYLLGDEGVAALIDPVAGQVDRDLSRAAELKLRVVYTIETHIHADHVTGGAAIRERVGSMSVIHESSHVECDAMRVRHGSIVQLGALRLQVIETPGHTPESVSYYLAGEPGRIFTGDALLIGTCGRTDFQGGDPGQLYDSLHQKLFRLPDDTIVLPAHDYQGNRSSTIEKERRSNSRAANRTRQEFIELMNNLNLPPPKNIDLALSANLRCGRPDVQGA